MQLCLIKELYNFVGWYVCRWRNNEKQFTLSNSQTDNHVIFTIFSFILVSIYETHLTVVLQTGSWFWKRTVYRLTVNQQGTWYSVSLSRVDKNGQRKKNIYMYWFRHILCSNKNLLEFKLKKCLTVNTGK